jgi:hypothetical protein
MQREPLADTLPYNRFLQQDTNSIRQSGRAGRAAVVERPMRGAASSLDTDYDTPPIVEAQPVLRRDAKVMADSWLATMRQLSRSTLYGPPPPPLDCESVEELDYDSPRPFSHLHQRGLWHASSHGSAVVVKKPVAVRVSASYHTTHENLCLI